MPGILCTSRHGGVLRFIQLFFLKNGLVDEVPETLYQAALLSHYFIQAVLRSAVPHRSENHGERGIFTAEKARVIKPEASHEGSRGRGSKPEELPVCAR